MYEFCLQNDLSQVWAYLWNQWYTPDQWVLWARSANEAIPWLKTTMVVESLWKNIKHRDLAMYNRPRLDLVTHLVIANVLPRVQRTLDYVLGHRRIGRAKPLAGWQTDFRADWVDMSRVDEHHLIKKELRWLKAPANTKGRTKRLAEIAEEAQRPHGTYHTSLEEWTCSCPSYLISRFLLCKHLVWLANAKLNDVPITSLAFFAAICHNCYAPFYSIEGIHCTEDPSTNEGDDVDIHVLGDSIHTNSHGSKQTLSHVKAHSGRDVGTSTNEAIALENDMTARERGCVDGEGEALVPAVDSLLMGFEDNDGGEDRVSDSLFLKRK
jgi:SWIM zinc finger